MVMADTISSLRAFCSRRFSLHIVSLFVGGEGNKSWSDIHGLVHLVWRQLAVDLLHGLARTLHGGQRLHVDVCRLYRVDLLLERGDLRQGLLETVLMRLLASQGSLGSYCC